MQYYFRTSENVSQVPTSYAAARLATRNAHRAHIAYTYIIRLLRAIAGCSGGLSHGLGVRPSVRLSVSLSARSLHCGCVSKRLQIGTHTLLIITSTDDGLLGFININDPERPSSPKKGFW